MTGNIFATEQRQKHMPLFIVGGLVAVTVLGFVFFKIFETKPVVAPEEGTVSIKGTTLCLPHKDTSGPQTLECAYGLKDEKGQYYAIRDLDPTYKNISSLAMNSEVTLVGNFREETSKIYPIVGAIEISEIKY